MQLSSVIIADDDYRVIDDLKRTVQWEELGYVVVGTATNGLDALNLVRRYRPDLLITDIIMPSMTGLELIEQVRKSYPEMQILIISSYDEFEYAKTAITHGVADYILKTQITPVTFSQRLIEISNSAIAKKKLTQAALRQSLRDYFNYRGQTATSGQTNPVLCSISQHKYCFLVIGVHTPFVADKENFDRIVYENTVRIDDVIAAKFVDCSVPIRFAFGQFLILGFVATQDARQIYSSIQNYASKIRSIFDTAISRSVNIFIEDAPCALAEFREDFFRLQPLMQFHTAFCRGVNCSMRELSSQSYIPAEQEFPFAGIHWHSQSIQADLEKLRRYISKRIEEKDIATLHHMYWLMIGWLRANGEGDCAQLDESCYFMKPQMLTEHVCALILEQNEASRQDGEKELPLVVQKAVEYIQENFSDHAISVQSVSEAVNVSSGRLGVLFRKSLGKSINEYLTDVRIAHAVYLLENTSLKIYEVADQSGFNASHYFSDIMYKKTGKRPIDYKRLPLRE